MGQWFTPCMQVVLLFLVFPAAKTFLLKKKSDGRLYKVLEQSAAVMANGPVVKQRDAGVGSNPASCTFAL